MIAEQDDWKARYQQLKRELQDQEKQHAAQSQSQTEHSEQLRQLARMLAVELQGQDAQLDDRLEGILGALDSPEPRALKKPMRALDKSLRNCQTRRTRTAEEILSAVRRWISELKTLTEQDQHLNTLEFHRNLSQDSAQHYHQIPGLLAGVLRLQSEILDDLTQSDLTQSDQRGQNAQMDEDTQLILHHIAADLLDLIDGLHMRSSHRQQADALIQKLEQGFKLEQLPRIMHQVVELVSLCNRNLTGEFESYLLGVSRQLSDMHRELASNQRESNNGADAQKDLSVRVESEVNSMRTLTRRAADLGQLKSLVADQVSRIQSSVSHLREHEEARQEEAEKRHQKLTAQLRSVEEEAQQTMARVEEERLRSRLDPLTRLPNRTAYLERLDQELQKRRHTDRSLSLAVCDIDHFKQVNDTYGHLAGDKALRLMASVLQDSLRNTDFVARFGGEEFVVIMPSTPCEEAARVLDKLRAAIADSPFHFKGTPVPMTISIGVTEILREDSPEDVFGRADALLYRAKKDGRNRLCADFSHNSRSG